MSNDDHSGSPEPTEGLLGPAWQFPPRSNWPRAIQQAEREELEALLTHLWEALDPSMTPKSGAGRLRLLVLLQTALDLCIAGDPPPLTPAQAGLWLEERLQDGR